MPQFTEVPPMRRKILAIDPGTTQSAFVLYDGDILSFGKVNNEQMLSVVMRRDFDYLAVEMVASFGMPVGKEVFETVYWIGRFVQAWSKDDMTKRILRKEVCVHLCGTARAKDPNIRQALLDRIGPQGTKKAPGPTYGISKDVWSALAIGVTCRDMLRAAKKTKKN